ncbi:MAG TPA: FAD-linked oxidase C-terminal domain-containing protein, partial [Solirubrobacteraceae bacterium]
LKSLLIGSEGTLGMITAVRLRLLPAPEARATLVVLLRDRAQGCAAMLEMLAAGMQPSALEFLDGETLEIVAGSYPGAPAPREAGFALLIEVDGSRGETDAQRRALLKLLAEHAVAIEEPADTGALWRWRDGFNPATAGVRGGKVSEDVAFPVERLGEGLARFAEIAERQGLRSCAWGHGGEGNVHATVLVDPSSSRELEAARTIGEELFALVVELGGSVAAEHGVGRLKRGRLAQQWDEPAVALHDAIKRTFDPKDLFNPGVKSGTSGS